MHSAQRGLAAELQRATEELVRAESVCASALAQLKLARERVTTARRAWRDNVLLHGTRDQITAALGLAPSSIRSVRARAKKRPATPTPTPNPNTTENTL